MSLAHAPIRKRLPNRIERVASRLLLMAALAVHGLGSAAAAVATPATGQPPEVTMTSALPLLPPATHNGWRVSGAASAPRAPRPEAPRLGGDCCKSSTCRCGCLYSVAAIAITLLGGQATVLSATSGPT